MANQLHPDSGLKYPAWESEYQAAIREKNPLLLGAKIYAAESAIARRLQALTEDLSRSAEEDQAIKAAQESLQKLQLTAFGHPDWQT